MSVGDIYNVEVQFECPTSAASFGLYYQEVEQVVPSDGTRILAGVFATAFEDAIPDAISDDYAWSGLIVRKNAIDPEPMWREQIIGAAGRASGPGLPANNAFQINLFQETFGKKSNGRIFVPGVPEPQTDVGRVEAGHLAGPLQALADAIFAGLDAGGGNGQWAPGVISRKVLDAAPPAKDWSGAFALITETAPWPIIATQKRRVTRSDGWAA